MDSVVILPKEIATEVARDLVRLDRCDSIADIQRQQIALLQRQLETQTLVVRNQKKVIDNQATMLNGKDKALQIRKEQADHWKKAWKKQKRQTVVVGIAGLVLIVLAGLL